MRQAGRYLPEYRALRAGCPSFLAFCYSPELAAEATLQPIRRFDFDAAILFSDILVVPDALGQEVRFEAGEGPRLRPLEPDLEGLAPSLNPRKVGQVAEAAARARALLSPEKALIGFCGAPWTVASYMIGGGSSPDQQAVRLFAYRHPDAFKALIDRLVEASVAFLMAQVDAGVDVIQIFDSWAGVLPTGELRRWCVEPVGRMLQELRLRAPHVKSIVFPRGVGNRLTAYGDLPCHALGLDTAADAALAARALPSGLTLQGNLDPLALVAGGAALDEAIAQAQENFRDRAWIFNLGHGVVPETPVEHVQKLVEALRGSG
jgi:uroporphyrinogen decarboxylase